MEMKGNYNSVPGYMENGRWSRIRLAERQTAASTCALKLCISPPSCMTDWWLTGNKGRENPKP